MEDLSELTATESPAADDARDTYVGTLVGESTSSEFRIAVAKEAIREQDIVAVDVTLQQPNGEEEAQELRLWAKVQSIERINPLFPKESGHELAETQTNPFDTVMSLSREMVTAVCQILGSEPRETTSGGALDQVRYPPKPASQAYRPEADDIARVVLGEMDPDDRRGLDIAHLANREGIDVQVDGDAVVSRHLSILAMTGAGKSWMARRIVEELADLNYPIVIFDPHGDYTGLAEVEEYSDMVERYYAEFPLFEEGSETVARIVDTLGYELTSTMNTRFGDIFDAARSFYVERDDERQQREEWLADLLNRPDIARYGIERNMWLVAQMAEAGEAVLRQDEDSHERQQNEQQLIEWGQWNAFQNYTGRDKSTLEGIKKRSYSAASELRRMEEINRQTAAEGAQPLPTDRRELVQYGQISVISLGGYTEDFQATIYSLIAEDIFDARVRGELGQRAFLLLEEAHKFAPAQSGTSTSKERAITTSRQIAQEGRKFGIGLGLISQRPSRLDETTLSMCNSSIIMRMVNPADQSYVRRTVESLGEDEAEILPDLETGEAIFAGQFVNFPVLAKGKPPESRSERETEESESAFEQIEQIQNEESQ